MALWQYQAKAEPLLPLLTDDTIKLAWYQPASEPVRRHAPRPRGGLVFVSPAADGPPVPDVCTWAFEPPRQAPTRHQVRPGGLVEPLEPTLRTTLDALSWWQPASERNRTHPPRQPGQWTGILQLEAFTPAPELSWFARASEPVRRKVERLPGWWSGVLDPTLFVVPDLTGWYRPLSEPVRRKVERLPGSWDGVLELEDLMLKWYRPLSEPVRRPTRPTSDGALVIEEAAFGDSGVRFCAPSGRPDSEDAQRPRADSEDVVRPRTTNRRTQRG